MKHPIAARRLREALQEKNLTAKELSDLSKVSQASISQYINGSHSPSSVSSKKMADVLGVSPLWLMEFDVPKIDMASRILKYRDKLSALRPELQEKVFSYIDAMYDINQED